MATESFRSIRCERCGGWFMGYVVDLGDEELSPTHACPGEAPDA